MTQTVDLVVEGLRSEQLDEAAKKSRKPSPTLANALIAAVFSIRAKESQWKGVSQRFTQWLVDREIEAKDDLRLLTSYFEEMSEDGLFNNQKIKERDKKDILWSMASALTNRNIQSKDDILNCTEDELDAVMCELESQYGVGPALLQYFRIMCGLPQFVKGDTMVVSFVSRAVGKTITPAESSKLLQDAAKKLGVEPADLDLAVWNYERNYRQEFKANR